MSSTKDVTLVEVSKERIPFEILHICTGFSNQGLYDQLVTSLSKKNINQKIYIPVRTQTEVGKYKNDDLANVQYQYSYILNIFDRINYFGKIEKTTKDVLANIDVSTSQMIHAHFLFSDGGIAYKLNQLFNIPYIVAVRNTDLNIFFKYMIHLRSYGIRILEKADRIIFLSEAYKRQLFEKYIPLEYKDEFLKKTMVIPNGVNPFWLNNTYNRWHPLNNPFKVLYVGSFTKNKNIHMTIDAIASLRKKGKSIEFTIVGDGGNFDKKIRRLAHKNKGWIQLIPRTSNKDELKKIYRDSDIFCMPSRLETFGLVYIEAMSQGLPVIFSKGQGIDGYFKDGEIGYSVNSKNMLDVCNKIEMIFKNYQYLSSNCTKLANNFSWDKIADQYLEIYNIVVR